MEKVSSRMSLAPAKYKSKKVTHTFSLENADCCEIDIEIFDSQWVDKQWTFLYRLSFKSKDHAYKKQVAIEATSRGQSSIKILIEVLRLIDGVKYKNVSIYYKSDYAVKTYNGIYHLVKSKKVEASPNMHEIMDLYELSQTVGVKYYISVKTHKVIKTYSDKPFN